VEPLCAARPNGVGFGLVNRLTQEWCEAFEGAGLAVELVHRYLGLNCFPRRRGRGVEYDLVVAP